MQRTINVVAVVNDTEYPFEYKLYGEGDHRPWFKQAAEDAVRAAKLTTDRDNPQSVKVAVYVLKIVGTEIKRERAGTFSITPPYKPMTDAEFGVAQDEILATLPPEFHSFARTSAWDQGHSAGYEEVINILRELAYNIQEPITKYTNRLKGNKK